MKTRENLISEIGRISDNFIGIKTFKNPTTKIDISFAEPTLVDYVLEVLVWFLIIIFMLKMFK